MEILKTYTYKIGNVVYIVHFIDEKKGFIEVENKKGVIYVDEGGASWILKKWNYYFDYIEHKGLKFWHTCFLSNDCFNFEINGEHFRLFIYSSEVIEEDLKKIIIPKSIQNKILKLVK